MNSTCEKLGLNSTSYANPHGLANTLNVSSAFSVATTVKAAMKSELFR
jgi:D-alanyl-D-alanine carboxypeptidase